MKKLMKFINKRKILILIILVLVFYWIFIRPVVIRKKCYKDSVYTYGSFNGEVEDLNGSEYMKCLIKNGLEFKY